MTIHNRDRKKREVRRRMVSGGAEDAELQKRYERYKRFRTGLIIGILAALVIIAAGYFLFKEFYRYKTCELVKERELNEGSFVGYERFGSNVLKYSHDGATYYDASGKEVWVDGFEMNDPGAYIAGSFACLFDKGGNRIKIYDDMGPVGEAETLRPITKACISENGVCAVITEENDASYINFLSKTGENLDIEIKTRLDGDGYPLDIALSPNGTQLMAAFAYLKGAAVKSKVVFYDFSEIGKNIPTRLVGGFEEPFEGSMVTRVRYIGKNHAYAVSDSGICFFSLKNLSSPKIVAQHLIEDGEILQIFRSQAHLGVVSTNPAGSEMPYKLTWFNEDGSIEMTKDMPGKYDRVSSDDRNIYFTDDSSLLILNKNGREKYNGPIEDKAMVITGGKLPGTAVFSSPGYIREYRFR